MEKTEKKPTLMQQIVRFGLVGVMCFVVDYVIYRILNMVLEQTGLAERFKYYYLISQAISFVVSVTVNYLLSMKYVFSRKEGMSREKEFTIFIILSVIGMGVNELCLFIGIDLMYLNWTWLQGLMSESFAKNWFFKFGATGVVMVYNFITRKKFLDASNQAPKDESKE